MKRVPVVIVAAALVGLSLWGCASMTGTEKGAIAGAVGGGILGAIIGDKEGAVIGTFAGAIVGAVIGNYYDKQLASRAEAAKKYERKDERTGERKAEKPAEVLAVEDSSVTPEDIAYGGTVESKVQYTVLAPQEDRKIKVTETRTLVDGKERLELNKRQITRPQGTHVSVMRFKMPKDIPKHDYTLITSINDGKRTKSAKNPFKVL